MQPKINLKINLFLKKEYNEADSLIDMQLWKYLIVILFLEDKLGFIKNFKMFLFDVRIS